MNSSHPRPQDTLAVILGASAFPKSGELLSAESFRRSAEGVRDYLLDREGYSLSSDNLLYLFDSSKTPSDMDEEVSDFLQSRISARESVEPLTDLIVYYVGHGGFGVTNGDEYYLAIRATRMDNAVMSSYTVQSLATTLKKYATHLRRYVILDSCFSAKSYQHFQSSGPLEVAVQQTKHALPLRGTALLCASGPRNAAKAPPGALHTMFSGALISALKDGVDQDLPHFSLEQLWENVEERIRKTYGDEAVRPEVHFPNQLEGLIGRIPLFPNPRRSGHSLRAQLDALGHVVQGLRDGLVEAQKQNSATVVALGMIQAEVAVIARKVAVFENSPPKSISSANSNQPPDLGDIDIEASDWNRLPGEVKGMMLQAARARNSGLIWFVVCMCVNGLGFVSTFLLVSVKPLILLALVILFLLAICNIIAIGLDVIVESEKKAPHSGEPYWWESLDAFVEMRAVHVVTVFPGFRGTRVALYASFVVSTIGFFASLVSSSSGFK